MIFLLKSVSVVFYFLWVVCLPCNAEDNMMVIRTEQIISSKAGSIQELLNQVPGVSAGESSVSIRGSYKVKVFLDGSCINDPTSTIGGVKWESVNLHQVELIKISRGGGGAAYGSNASGGVILITSKPRTSGKETHGMIEAWKGNFNTTHVYGYLDQAINDFHLSGGAGFDRSDGYWENSDRDKRQGHAKLAYGDMDVSVSYLTEEKGYHGTVDFPTPNARNQYDLLSVQSNAAWQGIANRFYFRKADKANSDSDRNLSTFLKIMETGDALMVKDLAVGEGSFTMGLGIDHASAKASSFSSRTENKTWVFSSYTDRPKGIPIDYTLETRLSYHSEFGTSVSPELRLGFHRDAWSFETSIGMTHNTPSFYQRYNQTSSMSPNPDLGKETARNISARMILDLEKFWHLDRSWILTLSPFHNRIKDRITYIRDGSRLGQYRNLGNVSYTGIDVSTNLSVSEQLTLKGAWSYLEAKNEDTGKFLVGSSKHKIKADMVWEPVDRLNLRISPKYTSSAYSRTDNSKQVGGFTTWDFRAEYQLTPITLFLDIKNFTDTEYIYAEGYRGNPRSCVLGMRWQF